MVHNQVLGEHSMLLQSHAAHLLVSVQHVMAEREASSQHARWTSSSHTGIMLRV